MARGRVGFRMVVSSTIDADAQAFITAAAITDTTQKSAINTLVTSLKSYNIWTKMKAIYPFVGGTATSHKFNLKDPRDLDIAFRLSFLGGGWTHSSTGAKSNGTSSYANTFLSPSSNFNNTNLNHLSYYSRTDSAFSFEYVIGCATTGLSGHALIIRRNTNLGAFYSDYGTGVSYSSASNTNSTNGQGFFIGTQQGTSIKLYRNTTVLSSNTTVTSNTSPASDYISIGGININGTTQNFTNKETAFASIGDGLTDTEAANFYSAVQTYQISLNRQV